MPGKTYQYSLVIKETYLDVYGHMNNATYLTLFEEARWEFITQNGYGLNKIMETGLGPIILEVNMRYFKELRVREEVMIESQISSYERKISKLMQTMQRGNDLCCTAEFTVGLFNLKERKLILPTNEWLQALGLIE